jgi:transcriptional regulatory protein RtcR
MGTLAESGRISPAVVTEEIERLERSWRKPAGTQMGHVHRFLGVRAQEFDMFDLSQLESVLSACAQASSLSEAGRKLFSVSRLKKASSNDADRLKKYLARFGLDPKEIFAKD